MSRVKVECGTEKYVASHSREPKRGLVGTWWFRLYVPNEAVRWRDDSAYGTMAQARDFVLDCNGGWRRIARMEVLP